MAARRSIARRKQRAREDHALSKRPDKIHLVGSIGLDSAQEVFRIVGRAFGPRLKRVPDGEPGPRRLWVSFQYPFLRSSPFLRPDPSGAVRKTNGFPLLCLAEGVLPSEVRFGELGYAREARASYQDFCEARSKGDVAQSARFQVCLPTPMGVIYAFCTARNIEAIEAAYEAAVIREVREICRAIPPHDLCIQWDFCHEMIIWDGQPQDMFPLVGASPQEIVDRIARICAPISDEAELGFHLCYGDFGARHFVEPVDATKMVEVMNAFGAAVKRPIAYFHIPVPITRTDDEFYRPLQSLKLPRGTELYLGLVHAKDGAEGTRRRIEVARKYVSDFGIATECGFARARTRQVIEQILDVHVATTATPVN
jgi:methionine synthase II (cobalamin-independent)